MSADKREPALRPIFADLHVHIGSSGAGEPVKISASRQLTFQAIAEEASARKGIALVGVIDCHSPAVQTDIDRLLDTGEMTEEPDGGIRYRRTVILPGGEIEVREPGGGPFHLLAFLPTLAAMREWTAWMRPRMKNVNLSSQRIRATARELQDELLGRGGLLIPAHVFTPHRGLLGCSADRLSERLDPDGIAAIELGLSADSAMAGHLSELDHYAFLTNSDAHSAGMIGRECNELLLAEPTFAELAKALRGEGGRRVAANLGLHPKLGKYHTTYCSSCRRALPPDAEDAAACPGCGSERLVRGVAGRVAQLADREKPFWPPHRPPYRHQVPLSFFPGIGPRMRERMLGELGTEMEILHRLSRDAIASTAGEKLADAIVAAREGRLLFSAGSGGAYGRIETNPGV
ncbi:endonuclease Q family protein [Cohnella sp. REN36]|uniref:endonuclease Q family protein n=1 Tax=Cohnella sp. REN36 TaxID=2887347 RepID=UPI001D15117C|nr:endonuclease Q family protein [Cohnella sp. REN36]MCC3373440.1 endonuclease Q family protein [Cohnella sp. REN36]